MPIRVLRALQLKSILAIALVAASCHSDGPVAPVAVSSEPVYHRSGHGSPQTKDGAILDAAHEPEGDFPRLYFLPPLAKQPRFSGRFDLEARKTLVVEVRRMTGDQCTGKLVESFSGAGWKSPIDIEWSRGRGKHGDDKRGLYYELDWDVRDKKYDPGDYCISIRAGSEQLGIAHLRLVRKEKDAKRVPDNRIGVVIGDDLSIRFRVEKKKKPGEVQVASVSVDPATATLGLNATQQFTAVVLGTDGNVLTDREVSWSSSDDAIVSIEDDGLATAHTAGSVTITATADGVSGSATLQVVAPDLTIASLTAPSSVAVGATLTVATSVDNSGNADAPATTVRYRVLGPSGSEVASVVQTLDALAAGASATQSAAFTPAASWPRRVVVEVTADPEAAVTEQNESNNAATTDSITITIPDLQVTAVVVPAAIPAGGALTVDATVANAGTADAAATDIRFRVVAVGSGTEVASTTMSQDAVAAGGTAAISAAFSSTAGWPAQVVVEVTTDAGNTVIESDETNNSRTSTTIAFTNPDLVVASVTFSASTVVLRCALSIEAVVRNVGTGDAPATDLRFSLRNSLGAPFATVTVAQPALAAGASATLQATFTAGSDWPADVSGAADADFGATVPEADEANNSANSSVAVLARLSPPPGFQKLWVCGSNTSWTNANNWEPAGAPTAAQSAYIPAGGTHYPLLAAAQSITDLTIESGARVDLAAFNLTASGNVASGQMTGTTGALIMTGTAKTLSGSVPALSVQGTIALSASASAASVLLNANRSLDLKGFTLSVPGNFTVTANSGTFKHLLMTTGTDRLEVGGTMTLQGENVLTEGTVALRGNFAQAHRGQALQPPPGGTLFIFDGTAAQSVSFTNAGLSFFGDVEIRNTSASGVNFITSAYVDGQLVVAAGARLTQAVGAAVSYRTRLPVELAPAGYQVANSHVDDAVVLTQNVRLAWPSASVTINANNTLALNGFTLAVGGNFTVTANSSAFKHLLMTQATDRLEIGGMMSLFGENTLTAGAIALRGNFVQGHRATALQVAAGGTRFVFDGTALQTVSVPSNATSFFGDVEIRNASAAGVEFLTSMRVAGQLVVAAGARLTQTTGAAAFYTTRLPLELAPSGYQVTSSLVDDAVVLTQDVRLAWPSASVTIVANNTLALNGFTLAIGGNFTVNANSSAFKHLLMTQATDRLEIGGMMSLFGENTLTAGAIALRGNFVQGHRVSALQIPAGGTHFIFDGTVLQTVNVPNTPTSFFGDVTVAAGANVAVQQNLRVSGDLDLDGALTLSTGRALTVVGTLFFAGALTNNGTVNVGACVNEGGTFGGTGNNPCVVGPN